MRFQIENGLCIGVSNILSAFDTQTIGTKVVNHCWGFIHAVARQIKQHDFSADRIPGQGLIHVPEAIPYVSAGVGHPRTNPNDYVLREHRGVVGAYLKREFAASPVASCSVVVYTHEAYIRDPDITAEELDRVANCSHVLVAVLASPESTPSPLPVYRFVWNLAGGNREALVWTADEIRAKARDIISYSNKWVPVAD